MAELEKLGQKYRVALKVAKVLPRFVAIRWSSTVHRMMLPIETILPRMGYSCLVWEDKSALTILLESDDAVFSRMILRIQG